MGKLGFFMAAACTTRLLHHGSSLHHQTAASWQQPASPDCCTLVPLLVCDCLFVKENPAYFSANLYIERLFYYLPRP